MMVELKEKNLVGKCVLHKKSAAIILSKQDILSSAKKPVCNVIISADQILDLQSPTGG